MGRVIPLQTKLQKPTTVSCIVEEITTTLAKYTEEAILVPESSNLISDRINIYVSTFPKKCNMCGRVYRDRNFYLENTIALQPTHTFSGTIEEGGRIMEYRNCQCGSSLVIVTPCRRDCSDFGKMCRDYFDICLTRLVKQANMDPSEAINLLRVMFREVFNQCLFEHFHQKIEP